MYFDLHNESTTNSERGLHIKHGKPPLHLFINPGALRNRGLMYLRPRSVYRGHTRYNYLVPLKDRDDDFQTDFPIYGRAAHNYCTTTLCHLVQPPRRQE